MCFFGIRATWATSGRLGIQPDRMFPTFVWFPGIARKDVGMKIVIEIA